MLNEEIIVIKNILNNSGVIAFPTETVMGLGVIYNDKKAYDKLNLIKRRPEDKPYTLMVGDIKDIYLYAEVSDLAKKIINSFMPGPLTILLKSKDNIPTYVTHGTGVIGIRIPSHDVALSLLKGIEKPLLVPSANRSGEKPAMNAKEVKEIFKDELDYIIDGKIEGGLPSTIIDLTSDNYFIVRTGPITKEMIDKVIKEIN